MRYLNFKIITSSPLFEGQQEDYIDVNITAPPQTFCCSNCRGNRTVTMTTTANQEPFYQTCSSTKSIADVLVGWTGIPQAENPETCGTNIPSTIQSLSWQQTIRIPVKAYIDDRIDRDSSNIFIIQAKVLKFPDAILNFQQTLRVGSLEVF